MEYIFTHSPQCVINVQVKHPPGIAEGMTISYMKEREKVAIKPK